MGLGVRVKLVAYNAAVTAANGVIAVKKEATRAADIRTVQAELARLRATKARQEPAGAGACREPETAVAQKENIEREKDTVKKKLDEYAKDVMGQYEKTINRLLGEFQAGSRSPAHRTAMPAGRSAQAISF